MKRKLFIENKIKSNYLKSLFDKSLKIVQRGIEEIDNIDIYNIQDYDFAFLCLAKGFENILKIMNCCKTYTEKETYPTQKDLKKFGHNLTKLLEEIIPYYKLKQNTVKKRGYQNYTNDIAYLKKDKMLNKLIELLSEYNTNGRYFELDFVSNEKIFKQMNSQSRDIIDNNPLVKLNGIIYKMIADENPSLEEVGLVDDLKKPWLKVNKEKIIPPFKKLLGILLRQIGTGIYGEECKEFLTKEKYLYLKSAEYSVGEKNIVNLEQLK